MKKTAIYITIGALLLGLALWRPVVASEVSGSISTDGGSQNNSGGQQENQNPSPSPTPSPGHSSEVSGQLGNGNTTGGSEMSGEVTGGETNNGDGSNNSGAQNIVGFVTQGGDIYTGTTTLNADVEATSTPGISDDELAHLATLDFGPRYGMPSSYGSSFTPGPPDAGYSSLSVGGHSGDIVSPDASGLNSPFAYVPRAGEGPVLPDGEGTLAASALSGAAGLSMTQLILIATIGLILLASMGYAISRGNQGRAI